MILWIQSVLILNRVVWSTSVGNPGISHISFWSFGVKGRDVSLQTNWSSGFSPEKRGLCLSAKTCVSCSLSEVQRALHPHQLSGGLLCGAEYMGPSAFHMKEVLNSGPPLPGQVPYLRSINTEESTTYASGCFSAQASHLRTNRKVPFSIKYKSTEKLGDLLPAGELRGNKVWDICVSLHVCTTSATAHNEGVLCARREGDW